MRCLFHRTPFQLYAPHPTGSPRAVPSHGAEAGLQVALGQVSSNDFDAFVVRAVEVPQQKHVEQHRRGKSPLRRCAALPLAVVGPPWRGFPTRCALLVARRFARARGGCRAPPFAELIVAARHPFSDCLSACSTIHNTAKKGAETGGVERKGRLVGHNVRGPKKEKIQV